MSCNLISTAVLAQMQDIHAILRCGVENRLKDDTSRFVRLPQQTNNLIYPMQRQLQSNFSIPFETQDEKKHQRCRNGQQHNRSFFYENVYLHCTQIDRRIDFLKKINTTTTHHHKSAIMSRCLPQVETKWGFLLRIFRAESCISEY